VIENEQQLRYSIESVAKMYSLCDRIGEQTIGDADTRADEIESVESMIRKLEREIAEYLAKKYNILRKRSERAA
jgi:hypothetical protein